MTFEWDERKANSREGKEYFKKIADGLEPLEEDVGF